MSERQNAFDKLNFIEQLQNRLKNLSTIVQS